MGTKNHPGQFDCYANAHPDEPMFVLLGRDPAAALAVTFWRAVKMEMRKNGDSDITDEKLDEARECSVAMEWWAKREGKPVEAALNAMARVLAGAARSKPVG